MDEKSVDIVKNAQYAFYKRSWESLSGQFPKGTRQELSASRHDQRAYTSMTIELSPPETKKNGRQGGAHRACRRSVKKASKKKIKNTRGSPD
jgi:hypothetical protein